MRDVIIGFDCGMDDLRKLELQQKEMCGDLFAVVNGQRFNSNASRKDFFSR